MTDSFTHESLRATEEIAPPSERSFGLTIAAFFVLVGLWPLVRGGPMRTYALGIAAVLLAVTLVRPAALGPLNRLWLRFGLLLHRIVSPVVLALLFFATVTPIGLAMRWLGKNPLALGFDPDLDTYWIERRPPGPAPDSMRRQF